MNLNHKVSRINTLINRLENGGTASNRSLARVLTVDQMKTLKGEWADENKSRKVVKPKEIKRYAVMVKTALLLDGRMEQMNARKSATHKIKAMAYKADSAFEYALEYIKEQIAYDRELCLWIDRDVSEANCSVAAIPRVIGSSSAECRIKSKYPYLTLSKKHLKLGALHSALEELQPPSLETEEKVDVLRKKRLKVYNFEGFRF